MTLQSYPTLYTNVLCSGGVSTGSKTIRFLCDNQSLSHGMDKTYADLYVVTGIQIWQSRSNLSPTPRADVDIRVATQTLGHL